ncbi:hypothetical protein Hanom_Chr17g01532171 [Helianthus anomalus]
MPVFNLVTESTLISQEGPSMTQKGYAEQNHLKLPSIVILFLILDWVVPMLQPCLEVNFLFTYILLIIFLTI